MSRINTNVSSLLAQRILGQQNKSLSVSLERLSTGLQINRGADNPAGLIASENLRSEKSAISAAIGNAERADQVVNIAEGGLQEISGLLIELQSLVGQSANRAGLSVEEKNANQLQIDSILQTIDRIAGATSFQGVKLLNGTYDFTISGQAAQVEDYTINAAKLSHNGTRDVNVVVTRSAQHGALFLSVDATSLALDDDSESRFVFELAGLKGSRQFSFASTTSVDAIASAINTFVSVTGVSATVSGNGVALKSVDYGLEAFVSVKIVGDASQPGSITRYDGKDEYTGVAAGAQAFSTATNPIRDYGQDVGASLNGIAATARGKTVSINTDYLDLRVSLTDAGANTPGTFTAFSITGGGAKFNLGPKVNITNQVSVGIGNVAVRNLGGVALGYLDQLSSGKASNVVNGNPETAQSIVDAAIAQVASLRGRLGAFQQNVVGATIRSLGVALENTSAAESMIRDTDFAAQTASLTRSQILVNAATNVLSIANSQPQSVLNLLK